MYWFTHLSRWALMAVVVAVPLAAEAQEVSWFGRFFGSPSAAPSARAYDGGGFSSEPLRVDVRPMRSSRRQARTQRPRVRRVVRTARVAPPAAQNEAYARLDPALNPNWYLEDPTLRRGDIVVLDRGIRVFVGRKAAAHTDEDFQAPADVRDISIAERQRLEKLAVFGAD